MTSRRRFIQALAAIPPALSFRPVWAANPAAPDPSRLALIIGNSAYRDSPLVNPANDAKAVGSLFTQAGFTVDSHLNATRVDMLAAIERFGAAAKRPTRGWWCSITPATAPSSTGATTCCRWTPWCRSRTT
jgi:hypothetical protein